jgi:hypothetical protein
MVSVLSLYTRLWNLARERTKPSPGRSFAWGCFRKNIFCYAGLEAAITLPLFGRIPSAAAVLVDELGTRSLQRLSLAESASASKRQGQGQFQVVGAGPS